MNTTRKCRLEAELHAARNHHRQSSYKSAAASHLLRVFHLSGTHTTPYFFFTYSVIPFRRRSAARLVRQAIISPIKSMLCEQFTNMGTRTLSCSRSIASRAVAHQYSVSERLGSPVDRSETNLFIPAKNSTALSIVIQQS